MSSEFARGSSDLPPQTPIPFGTDAQPTPKLGIPARGTALPSFEPGSQLPTPQKPMRILRSAANTPEVLASTSLEAPEPPVLPRSNDPPTPYEREGTRITIVNPRDKEVPNIALIPPHGIEAYLTEQRDAFAEKFGTYHHSHERAHLKRLASAVGTLATKLDIPELTQRVPDPRHVHLFDRRRSFHEALAAVRPHHLSEPDNPAHWGTSYSEAGIIYHVSGDQRANAAGIAHEYGHNMGYRNVTPRIRRDDAGIVMRDHDNAPTVSVEVHDGYDEHGLTEYAAERIGGTLMSLAQYPSRRLGRGHLNIIGDAITKKTARELGVRPEEVDEHIMRGQILGTTVGKEMIVSALGKDVGEAFFNFDADVDLDERAARAKAFANDAGLPVALENLKLYDNRQQPEIFDWEFDDAADRPAVAYPWVNPLVTRLRKPR